MDNLADRIQYGMKMGLMHQGSSPRKHIFFVVSSMQGGGAERVAAYLSNHWVSNGHDVTLMPTFSGRGECLYPLDGRVRLDYLADHVKSVSRSPWNSVRRFLALRRVIREAQPDVIVSFLIQVNVVVLVAAFGLRIPVVVSERSDPRLFAIGGFWELGRRLTYWCAKWVIVQTEDVRQYIKANCYGARALVVPNPVVWPIPATEPAIRPEEVVCQERRVLLAVGRLGREKGFDILIKAFAAVASLAPDWDLVILGEGSERGALEAQCDALGLKDRTHLPGYVGNVGDWYERADLYVLSSRYEGFPNALMEAMACGVPAIAVDNSSGPRDIIRHELDGLLVPVDEGVEGIANALKNIMTSESVRQRLAERAGDVRKRFSMESVGVAWGGVLGLEE